MNEFKIEFLNMRAPRPERLILFDEADSTNERARRYPELPDGAEAYELQGNAPASVFIADRQTRGRGRLGRTFVSPGDAGLYMSVRIRLPEPLSRSVSVTPFAAIAAARAIEHLTGADIKIKWVNDLYLGGKKLAGILTESVPEETDGDHCTLVIGIGVNVRTSAMPEEIAKIATSLEAEGFSADRAALAREIAHELLSGIEHRDSAEIADEYRRRSNLIGKRVSVITQGGSYEADAIGITDSFELQVRLPDGEERNLSSGEVSCRVL